MVNLDYTTVIHGIFSTLQSYTLFIIGPTRFLHLLKNRTSQKIIHFLTQYFENPGITEFHKLLNTTICKKSYISYSSILSL
ncbi:hypothetical protein HMPREF9012_1295 [Bacteroidetes bacterium oral taxon 272 str. F0290]|nr:hypothetical protein HMPREF9012_1295 [Bacteroidetes bacterium oral taxon 272 str. F0290]